MNLAGGALTIATKMWLPELFDRTLAQPLQFGRYYFNLSPALQGYLGGGMRIRPRDFLKVGQLYLNGGIWNGKRVVAQSWVIQSTSKQIYGTINDGDGYAWHRNTLKSGTRTYREYEANGNGGQFLIVVPSSTSQSYSPQVIMATTEFGVGSGTTWSRMQSFPR